VPAHAALEGLAVDLGQDLGQDLGDLPSAGESEPGYDVGFDPALQAAAFAELSASAAEHVPGRRPCP
jgi:hypothetical protein